jgi:D-sedoheptulose 7-phosphate isomerase
MDAARSIGMNQQAFQNYSKLLQETLRDANWDTVGGLAEELLGCRRTKRQVFVCGNGGSAANAIHLVNDFVYSGLRAHALPANSAVMTCLANDEGYEKIFSLQLAVQAQKDDILIVLSGSGNSPNIIKALEQANQMQMRTYGILGYSGGLAKNLVQSRIYFPVNDMQISEDLQLIVGHMITQWLYAHK